MNKPTCLLWLVMIAAPLLGISQDKNNNVDQRLIGKWRFKYVSEEDRSKEKKVYLVKDTAQPGNFDSYFAINITEKGASLEQRIGGLVCVGMTKISSTSCTIDNNKISLYIRESYRSGKKFSKSKESYEIISIKEDIIELRELERKREYFK